MSKLSQIQGNIKCGKNQYNNFGNYYYRSLEDIFETLKPVLAKYNCFIMFDDSVVSVDGHLFYIAFAKLYDEEKPDKPLAYSQGWAMHDGERKGMSSAQVTGAVSSYARKYALNGLFCLDDTKDDDAQNTHQTGQSNTARTARTRRTGK